MEILGNKDLEQLKKIRIKTQVLLEKIGEYLTKEIEGLELMYATVFNDRSNRERLQSLKGNSEINEKIVKDIILISVLPLFDLKERKSSANMEDVIFLEGGGSITISVFFNSIFNKIYALPCQVFISVNLYSYD